jgi:hypothetical protein
MRPTEIPFQNGPNPNAPWHAPSTSSICQHNTAVSQTAYGRGGEAPKEKIVKKIIMGPRATDLFRGVGAEHDGVFRADDHFVLDAYSDAVKVFGELRIGRDVDTF